MAEYRDVIDKIMSQLGTTSVEAIFGESRQIGDKVIIPVGKVSYGWGGGAGKGGPKGQEQEGEGGGIGMGVKVKPIGFITVTADKVTYNPVVDVGPVMVMLSSFMALAFLKLFKATARKKAYHTYGMYGRRQHGGRTMK